jgi:molybdopterin converting factor small subunit
MSNLTIQVFDGRLPRKISMDTVPEDFSALLAEIERLYPEQSQSLLERSFKDGWLQDYTILLNKKHVHALDEKINPGDEITILGVFAGG